MGQGHGGERARFLRDENKLLDTKFTKFGTALRASASGP